MTALSHYIPHIYRRVGYKEYVIFKGERLVHQWERMNWFKLNDWKKGRGRPKITFHRSSKKGCQLSNREWLRIE